MIKYEKFTLANGLQVVVHPDPSVKTAVVNLLYDVGSRDESPHKTGFAHLFEHLMFQGSLHIPSYDEPLQRAGGENNAFTTPDFTNYYLSLPSHNLETAFWLESDRMLSLAFDEQGLEVQRKVVIEEFKQRYLDQPYGDAWLHLMPLAYHTHPYRWNTIGKEISHIEGAAMHDVKAFFKKFYVPNQAILVVAGDVSHAAVQALTDKWFAPIPSGAPYERKLPAEAPQREARLANASGDVPLNAFYKAYHVPGRNDRHYHTIELLGELLGGSKSSRLYDVLVHQKKLLHGVSAYMTGSIDPGLLVISGKLKDNVSFETLEAEIQTVISDLLHHGLREGELEKVKMQQETSHVFSEVDLLNRAMNLAYFTLLGDTEAINEQMTHIRAITETQVLAQAHTLLTPANSATLHYHKRKEAEARDTNR